MFAVNNKTTYVVQPLEYYCTMTVEIRWQKATGNRLQEVGIWLNVIREEESGDDWPRGLCSTRDIIKMMTHHPSVLWKAQRKENYSMADYSTLTLLV